MFFCRMGRGCSSFLGKGGLQLARCNQLRHAAGGPTALKPRSGHRFGDSDGRRFDSGAAVGVWIGSTLKSTTPFTEASLTFGSSSKPMGIKKVGTKCLKARNPRLVSFSRGSPSLGRSGLSASSGLAEDFFRRAPHLGGGRSDRRLEPRARQEKPPDWLGWIWARCHFRNRKYLG